MFGRNDPSTHAYLHAYLHTYIHTHIHIYIHTYMHTCIHKYIHTYNNLGNITVSLGFLRMFRLLEAFSYLSFFTNIPTPGFHNDLFTVLNSGRIIWTLFIMFTDDTEFPPLHVVHTVNIKKIMLIPRILIDFGECQPPTPLRDGKVQAQDKHDTCAYTGFTKI